MASFKGSLKRVEILTKFVLVIITIILSSFLILLGNKILNDFDKWYEPPVFEKFVSKAALAEIEKKENEVNKKLDAINAQRYRLENAQDLAEQKYNSEKESFDNWIRTRGATESATENPTVLAKTKNLDKIRDERDAWRQKLKNFNESHGDIQKQFDDINKQKTEIIQKDRGRYEKEYRKYVLKIFLVRFLFVAPILGIGIFVFIKFKKSRFWPVVWGYIIFSLYVFFVGLVPYLPDFGGYIRYVVGIILSGFVGYYAIKQLAKYHAKKQSELEESREARAQGIEHETAIKAYQSHCCPSCEKDFLMKQWHPKTKAITSSITEDEAPSFCPHCGIELFGACPKCKNRIFVHFPFCSYCGNERHISV